jgi:hypothetical protein
MPIVKKKVTFYEKREKEAFSANIPSVAVLGEFGAAVI